MLAILRIFLQICSDEDIRLALQKCAWGVSTVDFLSYQIADGRIGISDSHRDAIRSLSGKNHSIDSICGFLAYFDQFMLDHDLMNCLRKGDAWTPEKELALNVIKEKLTNAPMRRLVNFKSTLQIYVDASETGFSSALMQEDTKGNVMEVVAFYNKICKFRHFLGSTLF